MCIQASCLMPCLTLQPLSIGKLQMIMLCAQVKPLGVYAMIDDGELDWKVIAIATSDPLADKLNDVEDVERCALMAAAKSLAQPATGLGKAPRTVLPHTGRSLGVNVLRRCVVPWDSCACGSVQLHGNCETSSMYACNATCSSSWRPAVKQTY